MITDILVIGSGIAGLTFAIKIAEEFPERKVTIITKSEVLESNTRYAQGGIAAVWNDKKDNFEKHFNDTMTAGDFLNDPDIVNMVVNEAPERLKEIIAWGVQFDKDQKGNYSLGLEGGHSEKRILHHKDITGFEIEKTLLHKIQTCRNITILAHHFSIDLIVKDKKCIGAHILDLNSLASSSIYARMTLLATGGIGQVYENTTNPAIATGDGIAMALRAGALVQDMEFVQFHPTALYAPGENPSFLISEAVRGMGALLKTSEGNEFMLQYSNMGSLAARDIVARGIARELIKNNSPSVYLDCTMMNKKEFIRHFPNIHAKCLNEGIDISENWIPVVPAAHYLCGGIKTDSMGRTSIGNLYACGECACTGLHGANRLASNSLLEALVFAHHCYQHAANTLESIPYPDQQDMRPEIKHYLNSDLQMSGIKKKVNQMMSESAGIVRNNSSLLDALRQLQGLQKQLSGITEKDTIPWRSIELSNILTVALEIVNASLKRKENKGLFYSLDNEVSHNTLISS